MSYAMKRVLIVSALMMPIVNGCAQNTAGNSAFCDLGPYRYFDHVAADRWGDQYNATFEVVCE